MSYTITIQGAGPARRVSAGGDETLLDILRGEGAPVHAPCGGNGTCRQCRVTVTGPCREEGGAVTEYREEPVLACRCFPAGDLCVTVSEATGSRVLASARDIPGGGEGLGFAVDIGTTTVAAYLYDLASGKCLGTRGAMNAQRPYGGDVISRIQYCAREEGLATLSRLIREQLAGLARELCPEPGRIRRVSIAGNTVMEHIFAGLSPVGIGVAPFTPESLFGMEVPAADYLPGFSPDCPLYLCPAVAGYVGGDITAGLLSSGAAEAEKTVLFIDIGTNGEMALGSRDGFLCCATAAGPAFEGAEIECGSPAQDGAINRVDRDLSFTVLGGGEPRSLCGSGLIDAAAALLANERIDEGGYLEDEKYFFSPQVWLSARDVRKLQLAKAAVRAGAETLLSAAGKTCADLDEVLIAGGFGAYMRVESACAIGLLPPALLGRTRHVGNSAGMGAALALTPSGREALAALTAGCSYVELSSSAAFNEKYIDAMMMDEWEEVFHD